MKKDEINDYEDNLDVKDEMIEGVEVEADHQNYQDMVRNN